MESEIMDSTMSLCLGLNPQSYLTVI